MPFALSWLVLPLAATPSGACPHPRRASQRPAPCVHLRRPGRCDAARRRPRWTREPRMENPSGSLNDRREKKIFIHNFILWYYQFWHFWNWRSRTEHRTMLRFTASFWRHNLQRVSSSSRAFAATAWWKLRTFKVGGIPNSQEVCHLFFALAILICNATWSKHCGKVQKYTCKVQVYIYFQSTKVHVQRTKAYFQRAKLYFQSTRIYLQSTN